VKATKGQIEHLWVLDPLMREVESHFGILGDGRTAVIEMAAASGLGLLTEEERNPALTTTYGTGQLISAALDKDIDQLIIGIGGSATNDGGAGMAQALGVKLLDREGRSIGPGGGKLNQLHRIDASDLDQRLKHIRIFIASDVENPLCGPSGATMTYGPQKGASGNMLRELDRNLYHYGQKLEEKFGRKIMDIPGAGAAGGLGAGLLAFLNAEMKSGFEVIQTITDLEILVKEVDLVITGEGSMDEQTIFGKTPFGVASLAGKYGKPVIGIAGTLGKNHQLLYSHGFSALISVVDKPMDLKDAMNNIEGLLQSAAYNLFQLINMGRGLK
jgi:glycerate kinase